VFRTVEQSIATKEGNSIAILIRRLTYTKVAVVYRYDILPVTQEMEWVPVSKWVYLSLVNNRFLLFYPLSGGLPYGRTPVEGEVFSPTCELSISYI
jgi:hypothetical protein